MRYKIFLVIGFIGSGLIINSSAPARADSTLYAKSRVAAAQMPAATPEAPARGTESGKPGPMAFSTGTQNVSYKINRVVSAQKFRSKGPADSAPLATPRLTTNMMAALIPARFGATIQHGMDASRASGIVGNRFLEVNTVVRWMSLIALSIFICVVYMACGGAASKSANAQGDAAESSTTHIRGL